MLMCFDNTALATKEIPSRAVPAFEDAVFLPTIDAVSMPQKIA
jgi:hypothetical protein